ncbi:MAG: hypothetical protein M3Y30_02645 [Gemmatimonadota bacterium]|nr:hypothetical protein [Gemmatimonadota bacterium]
MLRSLTYTLRCVLVATLSLAMIFARPAMMPSHAVPGAQHGCGMTMSTHHSSHSDHRCPTTDHGACCDDCMCACAIGSDARASVVVLIAQYSHVATVIEYPAQVVRPRQPLALRLPPPVGPPLLVRS